MRRVNFILRAHSATLRFFQLGARPRGSACAPPGRSIKINTRSGEACDDRSSCACGGVLILIDCSGPCARKRFHEDARKKKRKVAEARRKMKFMRRGASSRSFFIACWRRAVLFDDNACVPRSVLTGPRCAIAELVRQLNSMRAHFIRPSEAVATPRTGARTHDAHRFTRMVFLTQNR